jgi:hypothetical protein
MNQLAAFRKVARRVRESSVIANRQRPSVAFHEVRDGTWEEFHGVPFEAFEALSIYLRRVLMRKEPTQYTRICDLLIKKGGDRVRPEVTRMLRSFNMLLAQDGHASTSMLDLFNRWLYVRAIARDARRTALRRLRHPHARSGCSADCGFITGSMLRLRHGLSTPCRRLESRSPGTSWS